MRVARRYTREPVFVSLRGLAPLFVLGLAACGGESPALLPRWVELTQGFQPRALEALATQLEARVQPSRSGRVSSDAEGRVWLELPLARTLWKAGALPCEWRAPLPAEGAMLLAEQRTLDLVDGATVWSQSQPRPGRPAPGLRLDGEELVLYLSEGAELSERLVCRARLEHGRARVGRWRSALGDLGANGILVFPGLPETVACEIPPQSRLCFTPVFARTSKSSPDAGAPASGVMRVRLDGEILFEAAHSAGSPAPSDWQRIELDVSGTHELAFEVEGTLPVLFAAPLLAPAEIGRPGARPWSESRPDLVLVLCDTFRADNLAEYGGAPELAPNLNQLTARSLRFLDARSTAAWTLPSIGSILSGVFPGQHGGTDLDRGVVEEVETLAEVLAQSGYRTAAVTDAGLFSRHFGQDQGFEWFEEVPVQRWNLGTTLALARRRLACDDGRPLFLVVHTYRVHGPMRVGAAEDGLPWKAVLLELRERRIAARAKAGASEEEAAQAAREELALSERDPELRGVGLRFYRDAVADLDAKLGGWLDELERADFFARGVLVLTADHGNSYGEHEQVGHGGDLFDVKLRVPLLFAGRGIAPRAVRGVVSLIDLAPTLAQLAGAEPAPSWLGTALFGTTLSGTSPLGTPPPDFAVERPAYAFDLKASHRQVALFAEGKKLMAPDVDALRAGTPTHAFDLTQDPLEEHDLAESTLWPGELGRALAASVEALLVPAAAARTLELSPELQQDLRAIGYGR